MSSVHHRNQRLIEELDKKDINFRKLAENKKYFVGQSDDLVLSDIEATNSAWCGLHNPEGSGVNIYVNVWTITSKNQVGGVNESPFNIQFVFNSNIPTGTTQSQKKICVNMTEPIKEPKGEIYYIDEQENLGDTIGGVQAFTRQVTDLQTVVSTEYGKYIIPEGKTVGLLLQETDDVARGVVAWGWWEEEISE